MMMEDDMIIYKDFVSLSIGIDTDSLCQAMGLAYENARSPNLVRNRGAS